MSSIHPPKPMRRYLPCLLLPLFAILTGCAGVSRVPLDKTAVAKVNNTEAKISITADEIIVRAQPSKVSAYAGGGLIPALIDASISKSRQTALEKISFPFYEQIADIDFRSIFTDRFKAGFDAKTLLPNANFHTSSIGISKTEVEERRGQMKAGDAFFGLRVFYEFSPDARSLIVVANPQLVTKDGETPIYTNSLIFASNQMPEGSPLEAWSKDGGKALSEAFKSSGEEIARMLTLDLQAPSNEALAANRASKPKVKVAVPFYGPFVFAANGAPVPLMTEGVEESATASRRIVRSEGGALFSLEK